LCYRGFRFKGSMRKKNPETLKHLIPKVKLRFFLDVFKMEELHTELRFYTSENIALYFMVLDNY